MTTTTTTMTNQRITQKIADLFKYKDGELFWVHPTGSRIKSGDKAGSPCPNGRLYVQVKGKKYLVHRIIYFLHHGDCPDYLDHIDRNPLNNRIENLRPVTKQQNSMNRSIHANNKTGFKGVHRQRNKYIASICIDGINQYLGSFDDPADAHRTYAEAAVIKFQEYANV